MTSTFRRGRDAAVVILLLALPFFVLRSNVRDHCDALARLPIRDSIESLNVSNAAAVALYAASRG